MLLPASTRSQLLDLMVAKCSEPGGVDLGWASVVAWASCWQSWVAIGVFSFAAKHSVLIPAGSAGEWLAAVSEVRILGIPVALACLPSVLRRGCMCTSSESSWALCWHCSAEWSRTRGAGQTRISDWLVRPKVEEREHALFRFRRRMQPST